MGEALVGSFEDERPTLPLQGDQRFAVPGRPHRVRGAGGQDLGSVEDGPGRAPAAVELSHLKLGHGGEKRPRRGGIIENNGCVRHHADAVDAGKFGRMDDPGGSAFNAGNLNGDHAFGRPARSGCSCRSQPGRVLGGRWTTYGAPACRDCRTGNR